MQEHDPFLRPDGFKSSPSRSHYKTRDNGVNPLIYRNHKSGNKMYADNVANTLIMI